MKERVGLLRLGKEADEIDGIAREDIGVGDVEPPVVEPEIAARARLAARAPVERIEELQRRRGLDLLHLQGRAQHRSQVSHVLGDQEIVLHEALDGPQAAAVDIAEPLGHGALDIEGEALLGAPGQEVQVAPDLPEEVLAAAEGDVLIVREELALAPVLAPVLAQSLAVEVFREPVQRVQVAQAALAVLDVGLHPVAQLAGAPVALVALG